MKYNIGQKVVPVSKTVDGWSSLNESSAWIYAKQKGQPYLYVVDYDVAVGAYVLSDSIEDDSGEYFNESDIKPFIESNFYIPELNAQDLVDKEEQRRQQLKKVLKELIDLL